MFETVFISEQITENRFGALLEISDKFMTKFNFFSSIILQFRLKTIMYDFKNSGYAFLLENAEFVTQKLGINF